MTTITQSVTVNRPVEQVWDFISNFENTTRWSRGVLEARQTPRRPSGSAPGCSLWSRASVGAAPPTTWSLSTSPTMLLLVAVVQASKAYARRHLPRPEPTSDNGGS
jgi:hypothetical protein